MGGKAPWSNGRAGTTGQSYHGLTQYTLACHDPLPPSLQAMAPVSASSDYHASWIYHTGGVTMWGWLVPYAIHKGRNRPSVRACSRSSRLDEYLDTADNRAAVDSRVVSPSPISDWGDMLRDTPVPC
jgi:predicted acyl esterase